jgi:hypothetical protein
MSFAEAAKRSVHVHDIPSWAVALVFSTLALAIILGAAVLLVATVAGKRQR